MKFTTGNLLSWTVFLFLALPLATGCGDPPTAEEPLAPITDDDREADPPAEEPATEEPAEPASESGDDPAADEPATDDPDTGDVLTEEEPVAEQPTDEESTDESAARERVLLGDPTLTSGIPGTGPLTLEQVREWLSDESNLAPLEVELPLGLAAGQAEIKGLDENPMTRAKIELGRQLYFDTRLSADKTISCATCHDPDHGYAQPTQFGVGIHDQVGDRNSPTAYNRILSDLQFWDGRAATLEEQAKGPIENPIEMGFTHDACVEEIQANPVYQYQFSKVFPGEGVTIDAIAKAIATFERAIVTGPSPFDFHELLRPFEAMHEEDLAELEEDDPVLFARYMKVLADADANPMSDSARRGRELFFSQKANCTACHVGANLTDEKFHNIGIGMDVEEPDLGRYLITGNEEDKGAFKTPTIRNVAQTPPYMHDGSLETLMDVVEWYVQGGFPHEHQSEDIRKLELTDEEKQDLVAFMEACTGPLPPVERGRLPE